MLGLPSLPFSLLWSTTICTPIVAISEVFCFLDIIIFFLQFYLVRQRKVQPIYGELIMNLFYHFIDAKIFHYIPLLEISQNMDFVMFMAVLLGFVLRMLKIIYYHLDVEDEYFRERIRSKPEEERNKWKIATKIWYIMVVGGFGVWWGVVGFFALYNLI